MMQIEAIAHTHTLTNKKLLANRIYIRTKTIVNFNFNEKINERLLINVCFFLMTT
jgi:hypothetical protein